MSESRELTGRGIGVAVLDTGIFPHMDFDHRIRGFADFVNHRTRAYDDNSHGTHVCGILAGSGAGCGGRYRGAAPGCSLIAGKVLDAQGSGRAEMILRAFGWLLANHRRLGIRIVNISVGTTCSSRVDHRILTDGVEALWDAGLVVVAAAGNQGPMPGSVTAPGSSKKIITVGSSDMLACGRESSGRGPTWECVRKPDVVAPGHRITACVPYEGTRPAYAPKSGTSMSTPYVSGAIARMLEKEPRLSNVEIKMLLMESAVDLGYPHNIQGWGLFDADRFLSM